jgi:hypothetical protein
MALGLLLRQARWTEDTETLVDIAIAEGRIVEIAQRISANARLRTSTASCDRRLRTDECADVTPRRDCPKRGRSAHRMCSARAGLPGRDASNSPNR